jgi:hypothetical protein
VKELADGWVGLGTSWDLLRMSVGSTVMVNWKRGDIMGKLVASGRRNGSGGLAGFERANSSSAGNLLNVFRKACMVEVFFAIVLHALLILVLNRGENDLNLTTEH